MPPYYIELKAKNPAFEDSDLKKSFFILWRHVTAVLLRRLRCQMQHARIDKCRKQNSDWVDLFRGNSMDLEFNTQGCDLYKSWRGLKMLHFGTSVVYWASTMGQMFVHSTVCNLSNNAPLVRVHFSTVTKSVISPHTVISHDKMTKWQCQVKWHSLWQ